MSKMSRLHSALPRDTFTPDDCDWDAPEPRNVRKTCLYTDKNEMVTEADARAAMSGHVSLMEFERTGTSASPHALYEKIAPEPPACPSPHPECSTDPAKWEYVAMLAPCYRQYRCRRCGRAECVDSSD